MIALILKIVGGGLLLLAFFAFGFMTAVILSSGEAKDRNEFTGL